LHEEWYKQYEADKDIFVTNIRAAFASMNSDEQKKLVDVMKKSLGYFAASDFIEKENTQTNDNSVQSINFPMTLSGSGIVQIKEK
jgi:hypothetical protein